MKRMIISISFLFLTNMYLFGNWYVNTGMHSLFLPKKDISSTYRISVLTFQPHIEIGYEKDITHNIKFNLESQFGQNTLNTAYYNPTPVYIPFIYTQTYIGCTPSLNINIVMTSNSAFLFGIGLDLKYILGKTKLISDFNNQIILYEDTIDSNLAAGLKLNIKFNINKYILKLDLLYSLTGIYNIIDTTGTIHYWNLGLSIGFYLK